MGGPLATRTLAQPTVAPVRWWSLTESMDCWWPSMSTPIAPVREAIRRFTNRLTSIELCHCRDLELHGPLSELFAGHRPSLMRSLRQTLIETFPLFVGSEFEVAHHDRGPNVGGRLPEG